MGFGIRCRAGIPASCTGAELSEHPITLIFPFAAGGGGDPAARRSHWKCPRCSTKLWFSKTPGGAGMLGAMAIKNAKPMVFSCSFLHNGLTVIRTIADPTSAMRRQRLHSYAPTTRTGLSSPQIRCAVYGDIKGLIAYAKANPGKLNIGMGGIGSADQIVLEIIKQWRN